jgi:hypothetical protein
MNMLLTVRGSRQTAVVAALVRAWPFSGAVHGLTAAATLSVVAVDRRATGSATSRTPERRCDYPPPPAPGGRGLPRNAK